MAPVACAMWPLAHPSPVSVVLRIRVTTFQFPHFLLRRCPHLTVVVVLLAVVSVALSIGFSPRRIMFDSLDKAVIRVGLVPTLH